MQQGVRIGVGTCEHYVLWVGYVSTYVTSLYTWKSNIFDLESPLLSLWYFSLYQKTNIYV